MTWPWIVLIGLACLRLGLFWGRMESRVNVRTLRDMHVETADLRHQLNANVRALYLARKDADTHKDRADGIKDRASASAKACEPTAEPARDVGWIVELGPGGPWATCPNGASWGRKYASVFYCRAQGDQWIADFSGDLINRFPRHLMTVVAVDRNTKISIKGGDDAAALSAPATAEPYVISPDQEDAALKALADAEYAAGQWALLETIIHNLRNPSQPDLKTDVLTHKARPFGHGIGIDATIEPYVVSPEEQDADAPERPKGTLYAIRSISKAGSFQYLEQTRYKLSSAYWTSDLSHACVWTIAENAMNRAAGIDRDLAVVAIPPEYWKVMS